MAKKGDTFVIALKEPHLDWGSVQVYEFSRSS